MSHPCLRCGACCAWFRVAFHWTEADTVLGGAVPAALLVGISKSGFASGIGALATRALQAIKRA